MIVLPVTPVSRFDLTPSISGAFTVVFFIILGGTLWKIFRRRLARQRLQQRRESEQNSNLQQQQPTTVPPHVYQAPYGQQQQSYSYQHSHSAYHQSSPYTQQNATYEHQQQDSEQPTAPPQDLFNSQQSSTNPNTITSNITETPNETTQQQRASDLIEALPTLTILEKHADQACPICLDPLIESPFTAGNCLHNVHKECLYAWLSKNSAATCPICQQPLVEEEQQQETHQHTATFPIQPQQVNHFSTATTTTGVPT